MKTTHIYGIRDLELGLFIYIGKGNIPQSRFEDHINGSGSEGVWELVKERGRNNFQIETLEIVEFEVPRDWVKRERFWVKKFREEGHPLCNKNDGGGGPTEHTEEVKAKMCGRIPWNKGVPCREETKCKLRVALSGENSQWYGVTGEAHPAYGYRHTEKALAKICEASSGENHPRGFLGKHRTEEWKQNHSEFLRQWHRTHESPTAKLYPAFYNVRIRDFIPSGVNLTKMCRENGLLVGPMMNLKYGITKQTRDGWRLATEDEVLANLTNFKF